MGFRCGQDEANFKNNVDHLGGQNLHFNAQNDYFEDIFNSSVSNWRIVFLIGEFYLKNSV